MDNIKSLYNRISFKLMTPNQRIEHIKNKEREHKRRIHLKTKRKSSFKTIKTN